MLLANTTAGSVWQNLINSDCLTNISNNILSQLTDVLNQLSHLNANEAIYLSGNGKPSVCVADVIELINKRIARHPTYRFGEKRIIMAYSGYFDGAARPNPGELGMGVSIVDDQQREIDWGYAYKPHGTNNEAEYLSAILLMRQALHHGYTKLDCYGDSQIVIKQINGEWSVSAESLKKLNKKALELASKFEHISFTWIARNKNSRADELSRIAIDNKDSDRKKQKVTNEVIESAPVSNVTPLQTKSKTIVRQLKNGNYLVVEDTLTCIVNTKTMSCNCPVFIINNQCKHTNTFIQCNQQA
ncbi:ribonuclease HI family protein [Colwellia sp. MSW7]|uniref:Ribonuclease HI family protein n=1 Tax=Colwellia maritima TaxID=2912588 RepID=A0ABS9X6U4_9GAMM|nr:ribonuclease HI family protein [Colwellia maritima]MCI2285929.1 ribonuclease HI family protein [Colwellia maritima]